MLVYSYDPGTGACLGALEAHESPLEPGVFLVPANATTLAPPEAQLGLAPFFVNGAWALLAENAAVDPQDAAPNAAIDAQIAALEALQTPRRMRDAVLTPEGAAWIAGLEAQIAELRALRAPEAS